MLSSAESSSKLSSNLVGFSFSNSAAASFFANIEPRRDGADAPPGAKEPRRDANTEGRRAWALNQGRDHESGINEGHSDGGRIEHPRGGDVVVISTCCEEQFIAASIVHLSWKRPSLRSECRRDADTEESNL